MTSEVSKEKKLRYGENLKPSSQAWERRRKVVFIGYATDDHNTAFSFMKKKRKWWWRRRF